MNDTFGLVLYTAFMVTKSYRVALKNYSVNSQSSDSARNNSELLQELVETNKEILKYLKGDE